MSAAHAHDDLHRLVDQLTSDQAREVRKHLLHLVEDESEADWDVPRELSIVGLIHAEPDLAERSGEIVREGLGR